jgi:ubiquinol oxidase
MSEPGTTPGARQPQGPMCQLGPEERRRWQRKTLAAPRRRYGADARLLFRLEDVVFGMARTLRKFRARELIARTPYQSWEQAAYLKAEKIRNGSRVAKLLETVNEDRAEQDNEEWHLIILEEQIAASGIRESPLRFRLLPQLIAFAVYQQFWLLRVLNPAWSYRLNADIEDHAEYEYAALVAEHPEWETTPYQSVVATGYGTYESLADVFRQIGCDEGVHKQISLARMKRPQPVP